MKVNPAPERLPPDWRTIARQHLSDVRVDVRARIGPAASPLLIEDPEADTFDLGRQIARTAAMHVAERLTDGDMRALIAARIEHLRAPGRSLDAGGNLGDTLAFGPAYHERELLEDLAYILRCYPNEIATEAHVALFGEAERAAEEEIESLREKAQTAHGRLALCALVSGGDPREG